MRSVVPFCVCFPWEGRVQWSIVIYVHPFGVYITAAVGSRVDVRHTDILRLVVLVDMGTPGSSAASAGCRGKV